MKKSLIALAVMAAAGAASAQSSVTLFGIVDMTVSYQKVNGGQKNTVLTNNGYNSSRLGFRGTEDLGGGMSASFWLEGALSPDDGTPAGLTFKRRSTVSLAGNWGEVRLGRDYVPTFWNATVFDPFGTNGVGQNVAGKMKSASFAVTPTTTLDLAKADPLYVRSNNMVEYFLPPNLGGVYGQLSYAFSEVAKPVTVVGNKADAGRYLGGRVGYASGPFNVAIAYGRTEGQETLASPDVKDWNLGGQWDFGVAKLMGYYDHSKYDAGATGDATLKSWLIGGLVPVGAGEVRLSYGQSKFDNSGPKANQWALGYVHNLSKRTALYATYAELKNKNGAALTIVPGNGVITTGVVNAKASGFDLGIRHSF
jgi:predicted porin